MLALIRPRFWGFIAIVLVAGSGKIVSAIDADWIGGTGNWNNASNWSGGVVPNDGTPAGSSYDVFIDDGGAADSVVTLDVSLDITSLTISAGDTLLFNNSRDLTLNGTSTLSNAGLLQMNGAGSNTDFTMNGGTVTLTGGGTITIGASASNRIRGANGGILVNADNTIEGSGLLGNNTLQMENQALIDANNSAVALTVDPNAGGMANTGTMRASNGATLSLLGGNYANTGGVIEALNGSFVNLANNAVVISGGTFSTSGTGEIRSTVGTGATLDGVTLSTGSTLSLANGFDLRFSSGTTFTNNGNVALNSTGSATDLSLLGGTVTFTGSGTITGSDALTNRITGTGTLILDTGQTFQGSGNIGNNAINVENRGLIDSTGTVGITLDPSGTFANSGTIRASNAVVRFNAGTYDNAGGLIEALTGTTVDFTNAGVTIVGGDLASSGTGQLRSTVNNGPTLDGVTLTSGSVFSMGNAFDFRLAAGTTVANNGTISLNSTGTGTDIILLGGTTTLTGSGTVVASDSLTNRITGSGTLVFDSGQVFQGSGAIGANLIDFENRGLIDSTGTVGITLDPVATFVNSGTIRATSGAIRLNAGAYDNTGGLIEALTGTTVDFTNANVTLTGGTLASSGTGQFRSTVGTGPTLDGVTLSSGSVFSMANADDLRLASGSTFVNDGTVQLNSTGGFTDITLLGGTTTIGGTGTIAASNDTDNRILGTGTLVFDANLTFQGAGQIGVNQIDIENRGLIDANSSAGITINPLNSFLNTGTVRASNSSTLTLTAGGTQVNDGAFEALTGGAIQLNNSMTGAGSWTADAGTININAGSDIATAGAITISNGGVLNLVTNAAVPTLSGSDLSLAGSGSQLLVNNGQVTLSGDYSFGITAETDMVWGTGSQLRMNGGVGLTPSQTALWAQMEVGGADLGLDPASHLGNPLGFINNFNLTRLVIGGGARVNLVDLFDNGNRGGIGGSAEALYVDTIEFLDAAGRINLNGLNLYYNNLIGAPGQILPEPYNSTVANNVPYPNTVDLGANYVVYYDEVTSDGNMILFDYFDTAAFLADPDVGVVIPDTFREFSLTDGGVFDTTGVNGALVRIPYSQTDFDALIGVLGFGEEHLRVFHRNLFGEIEDITATPDILERFGITTGPIDIFNNFVYGFTTSFSPLGVGIQPEPSTILLLLLSLGGFLWRRPRGGPRP